MIGAAALIEWLVLLAGAAALVAPWFISHRDGTLDDLARLTHRGPSRYLVPTGDGDFVTFDAYSQREAYDAMRQRDPYWIPPSAETDGRPQGN